MRQYGAIPAPLAAANTPAVGATQGLGTKGGAAVQTPDSGNFGEIFVYIDEDHEATGQLDLVFPGTPPTLFIAADEAFGTIAQSTDGPTKTVTISWSNDSFVARSEPYKIHYEWYNYLKAN